jgi:hypothetical protein
METQGKSSGIGKNDGKSRPVAGKTGKLSMERWFYNRELL